MNENYIEITSEMARQMYSAGKAVCLLNGENFIHETAIHPGHMGFEFYVQEFAFRSNCSIEQIRFFART